MDDIFVLPVKKSIDIKEKVETFLKNIDSIDELDLDIIENGVCIINNDEVVGYITFEEYCEYGLIRYFIFQKKLNLEKIFCMFNELTKIATIKKIDSLIAIGKNDEVIQLFKNLGFYKVDCNNLVINGRTIIGTELEYASILKYDIEEEQ